MITVTMEDIKAMPDDWLKPSTVARVMHMDTGRLIWYAKNGQLPFPVAVSGNRVKIGRIGFLRFYGYEEAEDADKEQRLHRIDERLDQITELMKKILERMESNEGRRMEMDQAGA